MIDRRTFLKLSAPVIVSIPLAVRAQTLAERGRFDEKQLPVARDLLLEMVNNERSEAGLSQLTLDGLACRVANEHARDMAQAGFLSHWGSDGRKSYQRYGLAGGTDALRENVASADPVQSLSPGPVLADLRDLHLSMLYETPPNDGHRKAILYPLNTHVGFGVALYERRLRLVEIYLARLISFDLVQPPGKDGATVLFIGHVLGQDYQLSGVEVCHEPLPVRPELDWLRTKRSIAFPDAYRTLRPRAPAGKIYVDGTVGDFELKPNGKFRVAVQLDKREPGIYTLIFFISRGRDERSVAGAQVCVLHQT